MEARRSVMRAGESFVGRSEKRLNANPVLTRLLLGSSQQVRSGGCIALIAVEYWYGNSQANDGCVAVTLAEAAHAGSDADIGVGLGLFEAEKNSSSRDLGVPSGNLTPILASTEIGLELGLVIWPFTENRSPA